MMVKMYKICLIHMACCYATVKIISYPGRSIFASNWEQKEHNQPHMKRLPAILSYDANMTLNNIRNLKLNSFILFVQDMPNTYGTSVRHCKNNISSR